MTRLNFLGGPVQVPCERLADLDVSLMAQIGVDLMQERLAARAQANHGYSAPGPHHPYHPHDVHEPTDDELVNAAFEQERLETLRALDLGDGGVVPPSQTNPTSPTSPSSTSAALPVRTSRTSRSSRRRIRANARRDQTDDHHADRADRAIDEVVHHLAMSLDWLGFQSRFEASHTLTHLVYVGTSTPPWLDRFIAIIGSVAQEGTLECSMTDAESRTTTFSRWRFTPQGMTQEADYQTVGSDNLSTWDLGGASPNWQSQANLIAWVFASGEALAREHWHDELPFMTSEELFSEPGTSTLCWLWERLQVVAHLTHLAQQARLAHGYGVDSIMEDTTSGWATERDQFLALARPVLIAAYQREARRLTAPSPLALPDISGIPTDLPDDQDGRGIDLPEDLGTPRAPMESVESMEPTEPLVSSDPIDDTDTLNASERQER